MPVKKGLKVLMLILALLAGNQWAEAAQPPVPSCDGKIDKYGFISLEGGGNYPVTYCMLDGNVYVMEAEGRVIAYVITNDEDCYEIWMDAATMTEHSKDGYLLKPENWGAKPNWFMEPSEGCAKK